MVAFAWAHLHFRAAHITRRLPERLARQSQHFKVLLCVCGVSSQRSSLQLCSFTRGVVVRGGVDRVRSYLQCFVHTMRQAHRMQGSLQTDNIHTEYSLLSHTNNSHNTLRTDRQTVTLANQRRAQHRHNGNRLRGFKCMPVKMPSTISSKRLRCPSKHRPKIQ